jgi:hypothetical protein
MLSVTWNTFLRAACLLVVVAGASALASAQSINNRTAYPGDIICLSPVEVPVFQALHVVGNAVVQGVSNPPPVVVKWVAFDNETGFRQFKFDEAEIDAFAKGNGDHLYACINNNSGVTVTFNLSQTVQ